MREANRPAESKDPYPGTQSFKNVRARNTTVPEAKSFTLLRSREIDR